MIDGDRKLDYERSAHEHWRWVAMGNQLLQASTYLEEEYSKARNIMQTEKAGKVPVGFQMLAPMIFLRASGVENLLKGLYVKNSNSVTDGNGVLKFAQHSLIDICKDLSIQTTKDTEIMLNKLSESIYSWGRYPLPKKYTYWRREDPQVTGIPPIFTWHESDEKTYLEFIEEVQKLL